MADMGLSYLGVFIGAGLILMIILVVGYLCLLYRARPTDGGGEGFLSGRYFPPCSSPWLSTRMRRCRVDAPDPDANLERQGAEGYYAKMRPNRVSIDFNPRVGDLNPCCGGFDT